MSSIKLSPNASGTGIFTIAAPNSNTDRTLTLPDNSGTVQVSGNPISGTTGTFTGLVDISAAGAGQIKFPATQNASSDANTLDDYEEGTWTPVLNNTGSGSYDIQRGSYVKVGKLVLCVGVLVKNSGTVTGGVTVSGLPFTSNNDYGSVAIDNAGGFTVDSGRINSNATAFTPKNAGVEIGSGTNSWNITFSVCYITA